METILRDLLDQEIDIILDFVRKYFAGDFDLFYQEILDEDIWDEDELLHWGLDNFEGPTIMFFLERDPKKIIEHVVDNFFVGVSKEDGRITYHASDSNDISDLFIRDQRGIVESVLTGDLWDMYYPNNTDLESILEDLNKKNYSYLQDWIVEELKDLKDSKIEVDDEVVVVDKQYIENLSISELADFIKEHTDLESTFYQLADEAEINAWETDVIRNFRDTLEEFTKMKNPLEESYITRIYNGKPTEKMVFTLDVTNIIGDMILEITKEDLKYPMENPLSNIGYFDELVNRTTGLLEMRIPEYADDYLKGKYLNEFFEERL